jgi:hypothetical protein
MPVRLPPPRSGSKAIEAPDRARGLECVQLASPASCRCGPSASFSLQRSGQLWDRVQQLATEEPGSPKADRPGIGHFHFHVQLVGVGWEVPHRPQLRNAGELYRRAAVQALLRHGGQVCSRRLLAGAEPNRVQARFIPGWHEPPARAGWPLAQTPSPPACDFHFKWKMPSRFFAEPCPIIYACQWACYATRSATCSRRGGGFEQAKPRVQ